jgi:tetratricopeptide (TPR) repeat protein
VEQPSGSELLGRVAERRRALDYRGALDAALAAIDAAEGHDLSLLLLELGRLQDEFGRYDDALRTYRAVEVAERLQPEPDSQPLRGLALARLAGILRTQGRHPEASDLLPEALTLAEAGPGESIELVEVLIEFGRFRQELDDYQTAEALHQRAVEVSERARPGPARDGAQVRSLAGLASSARAQGRFEQAERGFRRALALGEAAFGRDALEVAYVLNDFGILCKFWGRFEQGKRLYERSLAIVERAVGAEHPDVASLYHNLGGLEHARGDFTAAEPYARRSVEIREQTMGPHHLQTAADRAALAAILDGLGQHDEAEALLRSALEVLERTYGPEHYEIAVNLNNLGAIAQRRGDLTEAHWLYRRALTIKEKALNPQSPEVALTLNNLGLVCKLQGRYEEAEALYRRALDILEATVDPTHPNLAACLANYASLLNALDRMDEARPLTARAQTIDELRSETSEDDDASLG